MCEIIEEHQILRPAVECKLRYVPLSHTLERLVDVYLIVCLLLLLMLVLLLLFICLCL